MEENILFLGSWCLGSHLNATEKMKHLRLHLIAGIYMKNFQTDFKKIETIYERLLIQMSTLLNHYHGTTYSTAQWRVVLGPWLSYFLTILYDRWISVTNAYDQYRIKNVYILERKNRLQYVPENMDNFIECMVTDDWNEMIFADIIKYYDHHIH